MCDQTEVSYLENDVVWVKIGPIWWPGVVKDLEKDDEGKEILAGLKKKPIAVVKFFQEDNYEFVKNLDCIYHYSCRRKDEFIKKGLDKFRTGASHMKKFPADVTTAESLTNGDVNIINDPKFIPEKKESYSEIFGSGKKKTKKDSDLTSPRSKVRTSTKLTPYRPITHQRFINKVLHGESDHRVKTLIQSNASSEESASRSPYKCHICKFETSRVNVIVAHHRLSHSSENSINWTGSDSKLIRKKPVYKSRKLKSKKLFDTSRDSFAADDSSERKIKSKKEKTKNPEKKDGGSTSPSKRKMVDGSPSPDDGSDSKKPRFTDVLLADWNEDEEDDKEKKEPEDDGKEIDESPKTARTEEDGETKSENSSPAPAEKSQKAKKSCFDFDEEEEGFIGMSNANTYGRKIPRVIPVKDKPELGMDLEIDELFKKKSDSESETEDVDREDKNEGGGEKGEKVNEATGVAEDEENAAVQEEKSTPVAGTSKRRKSKAIKEEESKVNPENSLALRRTRRLGAKKSYLNEVIEKVEDDESKNESMERKESGDMVSEGVKNQEGVKVEVNSSSSSRRKQDFKNQTIDSEHREEMVYSDIVNSELKQKPGEGAGEKKKGKSETSRVEIKDDFTAQIDELLEETKPAAILESPSSKMEKPEEIRPASTNNFSFDYMPGEPTAGKKTGKTRTEVKSISRMFGDSIPSLETASDGDSQSAAVQAEPAANESPRDDLATSPSDSGQTGKSVSVGNFSLKRGSIVLSSVPKMTPESPAKVIPAAARQMNPSKECIVVPAGKKLIDSKDGEQSSEGEPTERLANIKTIKVKPDSLPSSLIGTRKLKGQTIIHQKSGKYVIVTQPPQLGRQKATPEKVQSGSKVVIFTNQHGEQKIITTSGLQQTKFKVDGQKLVAATAAASDSAEDKESVSSPSTTQSPAQPVIKMVPDGKGGIMKQLTVSPKKVLLGGTTKVYVSASGSNFSAGNNVQKIALASGGRSGGGDYRLIENYKGSGKMVLVQGGPGSGSGSSVVLKSSSVVPRQVTKVIQNQQVVPGGLKKKPKILMRTSTGQGVGEYVMQSASAGTAESPAFVVKQKRTDGKFSTQKILKTEVVSPIKVTASAGVAAGTKRFFLSGQGSNKKGESFIIATNEGTVPSKVIRMRQKIKEVDAAGVAATAKSPQKTVLTKAPEMYGVAQNSLLLPQQQSSAETETQPQIIQIQEQPQQPAVLQTQVIAMPGPVSVDGNQTYVLVSVDEHGVVQGMDNSVVAAYDAATAGQQDQIFANSTSATNNVILLNPQTNDEVTPVFSTSSQDILAEALANTNVLEGSINNEMDTVVPSILLPPTIPSSVVQETSITLQKPIMTPLEMPSSVAPDTSCLEPPPLPPTPTNEDVLMEEEEESSDKKEGETNSSDAIQTYLRPRNFSDSGVESFRVTDFAKESGNKKTFEDQFDGAKKPEGERGNDKEGSRKESDFFQELPVANAEEENEKESSEEAAVAVAAPLPPPREDFVIENSQEGEEESTTNSLQSMPLLNDEPDTSDDAQGSEPIADQQFESQKSRLDSEELSRLIREQEEPPSSTINEINSQENSTASEEFDESNCRRGREDDTVRENESTKGIKESDEGKLEGGGGGEGDQKGDEKQEKESMVGKENHSMPLVADETGFEIRDQGIISQRKRFQEETEVSSTTADEYAGKDVATN